MSVRVECPKDHCNGYRDSLNGLPLLVCPLVPPDRFVMVDPATVTVIGEAQFRCPLITVASTDPEILETPANRSEQA